MTGVVLDASVVPAFVYAEEGAEAVEPLLDGAMISTVNWSETLTTISARGGDRTGSAARSWHSGQSSHRSPGVPF